MIDQILSPIAAFFGAVARGFLLPGELLLSGIAWISPYAAEILSFGSSKAVITFVLAMLGWTIILVFGLLISRAFRALGWQAASKFRVLVWNLKMGLGSLKTKLLWKYRKFFPAKGAALETETENQGHFDDLDIAVLASISRSSNSMASSAAELAEKYRLQPAQVEDRLRRLANDQLLQVSVASRKGETSYQLTDAGLALIEVCKRQASARAGMTSVSAT